jgi:disulfide bond formation protein DsbB
MGGADYFHYLHLYEGWDIAHTEAPFNMRILGSFGTYLLNSTGLHYSTETVFGTVHPELSQQTFFNALLFNYLCVVATAWVLFMTARRQGLSNLHSLGGSLVFLLGFGTIFFLLKPANDACGVLLIAGGFYYYLQRSYLTILFLSLCVLQREYALLVFGVTAVIDYFFDRNRFYLITLISAAALFAIYFVMRKTIFFSPLHDGQTKPGFFLQSLLHPQIDWAPFIKQLALSCNIAFLYVVVLIHKRRKQQSIHTRHVWVTLALFIQVLIMSIAAGFGNNTGRIFYFTIPIIIHYILLETRDFVQRLS